MREDSVEGVHKCVGYTNVCCLRRVSSHLMLLATCLEIATYTAGSKAGSKAGSEQDLRQDCSSKIARFKARLLEQDCTI